MREDERRAHAEFQRVYFDKLANGFRQPIPADVEARTARIVETAALATDSRVLDVGTGTGVLIAHFLRAGVKPENITGCDLSSNMLLLARDRYPNVNFWQGDFLDFPSEQGPFDAIFFNACFGNFYDLDEAIQRAVMLLAMHGKIVISHPLGARFVVQLHTADIDLVPHFLPDRKRLLKWAAGHQLELETFVDDDDLYLAVLRSLHSRPKFAGQG